MNYALRNSKVKKSRFQICNIKRKKTIEMNCFFLQRYMIKKTRARQTMKKAKQLLLWKMNAHKKFMQNCENYYLDKIKWEYEIFKQVVDLKSTQKEMKVIIWSTNNSLKEILNLTHSNKFSKLKNYRLMIINKNSFMLKSKTQSLSLSYESRALSSNQHWEATFSYNNFIAFSYHLESIIRTSNSIIASFIAITSFSRQLIIKAFSNFFNLIELFLQVQKISFIDHELFMQCNFFNFIEIFSQIQITNHELFTQFNLFNINHKLFTHISKTWSHYLLSLEHRELVAQLEKTLSNLKLFRQSLIIEKNYLRISKSSLNDNLNVRESRTNVSITILRKWKLVNQCKDSTKASNFWRKEKDLLRKNRGHMTRNQ